MEHRDEIMGSELVRSWTEVYWRNKKNEDPPSRAWLVPFWAKIKGKDRAKPEPSDVASRKPEQEDAMDVDTRPPVIDLRVMQPKRASPDDHQQKNPGAKGKNPETELSTAPVKTSRNPETGTTVQNPCQLRMNSTLKTAPMPSLIPCNSPT